MPFAPAPGPAVAGPFSNLDALRAQAAKNLPTDEKPLTDLRHRQAFCLSLALDHLNPDGTVRFGSRLFSRLCQAVEARGDEVNGEWVEAYRLTWRYLLSQTLSPPQTNA